MPDYLPRPQYIQVDAFPQDVITPYGTHNQVRIVVTDSKFYILNMTGIGEPNILEEYDLESVRLNPTVGASWIITVKYVREVIPEPEGTEQELWDTLDITSKRSVGCGCGRKRLKTLRLWTEPVPFADIKA